MSLIGIVAGIAAVLAIIVTALVIAVCLAVSWMTDAFRGDRGDSQPGVRGGRRHAGQAPPFPGQQAGPPFPGQPRPPFPGQQARPPFPPQQPQDRYRPPAGHRRK
jgi:hypothetical protein